LFLHPVVSGQNIAALYKRAFAEAVELYVLSAYLRTWDTTLEINKGCGAFAFIVGSDFGITRKQACLDVLKWLPPQRKPFFLVADAISGFHPKALFWKTDGGQCYSLIGSSNLSDAGWNTNYEANVFAKLSAPEFKTVRAWIERIRERSVPMSKQWLDAYREVPPSRTRKPGARGGPSPSLSAIDLPTFRGQAAIIRERRVKKRKFTEIRPKLLSAIRLCASGKISDGKFYDILDKTWGSHASRIQGWGWQVTGRDSDFGALCRGLLSILNADAASRDFTVVRVIDELRTSSVPTRRALLSELLCLFFPADYPVLNKPVASYAQPYVKAPHGSSEGEKYLHLSLSLRAALHSIPQYPAKDLLELDGLIWKFMKAGNA
jgi:hypothetical protein